jgi:transcriptional regulator with GAF, ATPase, and Fis domain
MTLRPAAARVWLIWALIAAFAVIEGGAWIAAGGVPRRPVVLIQVVSAWIVMIVLAMTATRLIRSLADRLSQNERAHSATLDEVEQLQTQNAVLQIVAQSVDVTLTFQTLAMRIARLVPCDRVGLALLSEDGREFQTYTARVREKEQRPQRRAEVVFKSEGTAIGAVVRSRQPLLIRNASELAGDYLDVSVLHTAGFQSALVMPLIAKGRAVGTMNVVSRSPGMFDREHIEALRPIAEIFAVACVAQQLQVSLARLKTTEAMADLTLSTAADINSALQTIIGHCDLLDRGYQDPGLQRDLATVVRQAERIAALLQRMRTAAQQRLKEVAETVAQGQETIGD